MRSRNTSRLEAGLIARKGEAAPAPHEDAPPPAAAAPSPAPGTIPARQPRGLQGTIAVTVRLDPDRYERLKVHGARRRLTNQTIMLDALDRYLAGLTE